MRIVDNVLVRASLDVHLSTTFCCKAACDFSASATVLNAKARSSLDDAAPAASEGLKDERSDSSDETGSSERCDAADVIARAERVSARIHGSATSVGRGAANSARGSEE